MKVNKEGYYEELTKRFPTVSKMDPKVKVMLGNEEYLLEFTNKSAIEILKEKNYNILTDRLTPKQMGDPEFLSCVLYWGLIENKPEILRASVDSMFKVRHYVYVTRKIGEALTAFYPDMSDVEVDEPAAKGVEEEEEVGKEKRPT